MLKTLGTFARIWGRSLDKFGQSFQGSAVYVETLVPQTQYVAHNDKSPTVSNICFVAQNKAPLTLGCKKHKRRHVRVHLIPTLNNRDSATALSKFRSILPSKNQILRDIKESLRETAPPTRH